MNNLVLVSEAVTDCRRERNCSFKNTLDFPSFSKLFNFLQAINRSRSTLESRVEICRSHHDLVRDWMQNRQNASECQAAGEEREREREREREVVCH